MTFLTLKVIHILSAIILFGLGCGTVFFKMMADRSNNHAAIAVTSEHVVLADWWFTTPTVIIQPITGIMLANQLGLSLTDGWISQTFVLYFLTGNMLATCGLFTNAYARYCKTIFKRKQTFTQSVPLLFQNMDVAWRTCIFCHARDHNNDGFSLIFIINYAYNPFITETLGADWDKLSPVIQRHYNTSINSATCVIGNMEIGYPSYLLPLITLIHFCGGLVLTRGERIETIVKKTVCATNNTLFWSRTLKYQNNKKDYFFSKMTYLQDHELIETVQFGFGLRLKVSVEKGKLVYRSNGHIWQYGRFSADFS